MYAANSWLTQQWAVGDPESGAGCAVAMQLDVPGARASESVADFAEASQLDVPGARAKQAGC